MERKNDQLDTLVAAMLASANYKHVCKELITYIGAQELSKRRNVKEALKATKNKLHQIGSAYLDTRVHYESGLNELRMAAPSANRDNLLQVCTRIMNHHASTRERLPILEQFYSEIFTYLPPIRSVLDIACVLHPLAKRWMPLPEDAEYQVLYVYQDMWDFSTRY